VGKVLPEVFEQGAARGEGHLLQRTTGEHIPVEFHTFLIRAVRNGPPTHLGVVIRNLSDRQRADAERQALQEQLQQSQKLEAVGRLAGGVAHDFNNLLTGIGGCAELIELGLRPEDPLLEEVRQIAQATERGADLVRQLLAFSRQQVVSPRVIHPNETILHAQRMLARIIGEHIELVVDGREELWAVKVDPGQLDQILVNLATNARDAMPEGGTLRISTRNVTLPEGNHGEHPPDKVGDFVEIAVRDSGVGMAPEVLARVFEPFFTTKPVGQGTGLGLSTVYGIVEQAGGFVVVASEPGAGMTVDSAQPTGEPSGGPETVLLVEDDAMVRRPMERALTRLGYDVLVAPDGVVALQVIEQHAGRIDLVLTDLVMPRMGGRELVAQLRERYTDLRVIFMSGYADEPTGSPVVTEGREVFVQKPISIRVLSRRLRELLDG
jgi:signal transduction histidine kinase